MHLSYCLIRLADWLYPACFESLISRQTFRYALCGGLTYMVLDPLLYFVIYHFVVAYRFIDFGFVVISPHIASLAVVFPIIFGVGFWLNRQVAFRYSPLKTHTQLVRYALSIAGSILLTYAGMKFFVEWCGLWPTPSKVLTTICTTIYSYLAAKYYSFRAAEN